MTDPTQTDPRQMFSSFVQIGVVVADLEAATQHLSQVFGLGPFRVIDWPPEGRPDMLKFYHGQPGEFTARMAFTELGPVELELIQPLSGESIWQDFLRERGGGIHHLRFNTDNLDDMQAYLHTQGVEPAQHGSGIRPGTLWMNFDTEALVGFVIEAMQVAPGSDGRTPQIVNGKVVA